MKKIQTLLLGACGYTVLTLALFYIFATVGQLTGALIGFSMFALIFGFGCLISLAGMILSINKLAMPLRILIHYATLMVAFTVIFIISGNINASGPAAVFSAAVIFTFLYAAIFILTYFAKRGIQALDKKLDKHANTKDGKSNKPEYKSLYRSDN